MDGGILSQGNQEARIGRGECILWGSRTEQYSQMVMGMRHFDERHRGCYWGRCPWSLISVVHSLLRPRPWSTDLQRSRISAAAA